MNFNHRDDAVLIGTGCHRWGLGAGVNRLLCDWSKLLKRAPVQRHLAAGHGTKVHGAGCIFGRRQGQVEFSSQFKPRGRTDPVYMELALRYPNQEVRASVFYRYFAALGMVVRFQSRIYLFEFKVVEIDPQDNALAQLKAMNYAAKYLAEKLAIYLIGVEFSKKRSNIMGFEVCALGEGLSC